MPYYHARLRSFDHARHQFAMTVWPFRGLPIRYLEIGCLEGMSAVWMMTNVLTHPDSRCVIVDPWDDPSYGRRVDWVGAEKLARENLSPWIDRVAIIKDRWPGARSKVEGLFDVIYIDAIHKAESVYNDSVAAWPILKPGGFLIWDDWLDDVELGVTKFLSEIHGCYQVVSQQGQLHVRKVSDEPILWRDLRS